MDSREWICAKDTFAFAKTNLDVHTLGISNASTFLKECSIRVIVSDEEIGSCLERLRDPNNQKKMIDWIAKNRIDHIGFSYRLEPRDGERLFLDLYHFLRTNLLLKEQGGRIKKIIFSGLPKTCQMVEQSCSDRVITFGGGETPEEFLLRIGIPEYVFPMTLKSHTEYDSQRIKFADELYKSGDFESEGKPIHGDYLEFGTKYDRIERRIDFINKTKSTPIIRAHIGPYNADSEEALKLFSEWVKGLAKAGFLDVLSIGSSQLTQSHFEKDWSDLPNGGGVPVRNREDYYKIYQDARPMLVRSYAGTDRLQFMARIHEDYLNIAWHALSFWWFDRLDGRGPLSLDENLNQTFDTMSYIAFTGKALEANVSHQFAFRGADDLTYVITAFLTAKAAKLSGIKTFILQNMLNTPTLTWGINDVAKGRAMLQLVRSLEDKNFRVVYETRAGLSYFSPDLEKAKRQLMAVTMLMDDIDPNNDLSPEIIHVVGYSEAQYLADPTVVDESIKMSLHALKQYRLLKKRDSLLSVDEMQEIKNRTSLFIEDARRYIGAIEKKYPDAYTATGFFKLFYDGYLPTPQLWAERETFVKATAWNVKYLNGGYSVVDNNGKKIGIEDRLAILQ